MQLYRGIYSIIYRICTLCVLLSALGSTAVAQEGTPSTNTSSASANKLGTSNGTTSARTGRARTASDAQTAETTAEQGSRQKTNNQSIAQGLSVAEALLLNPSPWGFFLSSSLSRGLDEYADTLSSVNSLDTSYRLNSASSLNLSVGYSTIVYNYDGELFNNEDRDPKRFGFTDTDISYVRPNVWSDKYNRLVLSAGVTLPTSRLSNRNGLNFGTRYNAALRYKPTSKIIITPSVGAYIRSFRYDTANVVGVGGSTSYNSPLGVSYGLSGSYVFAQWLIGSVGYSQTQRYDYNNDWQTIQSLSTQLNIALNALNIYLGYSYRDLTITNEPLFDDDRSLIYTGVGYAF